MAKCKECPRCGCNLDWGERCECESKETAMLTTPREAIIDGLAAIEQKRAREKAIAQAVSRKGIYTAICRQTRTQ